MLGINKPVVDGPFKLRSKLHKHHTSLYSRGPAEAISAKILGLYHINGYINPADILRKNGGMLGQK